MRKQYTDLPKINWQLIVRVAEEIYRLGIGANKADPLLFPNIGVLDNTISEVEESASTRTPANPILHHGASTFPIYSILSNDVWLKGVIDPSERQDDPRMIAMRRLAVVRPARIERGF